MFNLVQKEIDYAAKRFGTFHSSHEHLGVLLEEFEEWKDEVKANTDKMPIALYELIQIAAVALRYVQEHGNIEMIQEVQRKRHLRD